MQKQTMNLRFLHKCKLLLTLKFGLDIFGHVNLSEGVLEKWGPSGQRPGTLEKVVRVT